MEKTFDEANMKYNKNIDYEYISKMSNDYSMDVLGELFKTGCIDKINPEMQQVLKDRFQEGKIVIVDSPNEQDYIRFNGSIPTAHGGRGKNDNYIHIYPFTYEKLTFDEILERYINEMILTHEINHFLFRMDFSELIDDRKFNEFMTEGIVQFYTEEMYGRKSESVEYRKNVELASKLINSLREKGQEDLLYKNKITDEIYKYIDFDSIINEWKSILEFNQNIEGLITESIQELNNKGQNLNPKQIYNRTKMKTVEETLEEVRKSINNNFKDDRKDYYLNKLFELENNSKLFNKESNNISL